MTMTSEALGDDFTEQAPSPDLDALDAAALAAKGWPQTLINTLRLLAVGIEIQEVGKLADPEKLHSP